MTEVSEIVNVRRRQERSTQTRQAILDAAKTEFAINGFGGTTTRGIAERAKVRHGLLVYHFDTKIGVWQAMMEQFLGVWSKRLMAAVEPLLYVDDVAALRALQRTFIEMSAADPDAHWLMSEVTRESSDRLSSLIERLIGQDIALILALIKRVQAQGYYELGNPAHLYYGFIGVSARVFMVPAEIQRVTGHVPFDHAFVVEHIALCERLFFRNLP